MGKWIESTLSEIVKIQKGKKVTTSPEILEGYKPYIGAETISSGEISVFAENSNAVFATTDDIVMLWDGERSGLVGHNLEGIVSSTVAKLTPNHDIEAIFLYYIIKFNFEWIQNRRTGTGVPHVPKDIGRTLQICYPKSIKQQQKIAAILTTIDTAIEKTETLIEKYRKIKTGLMNDLFTRGIGPDGKLRPPRSEAPELYKKTKLGWIPKDWEIVLLGRYSEIVSGITLSSRKKSIDQSIEVPYLRVANVHDGYLDLEDIKTQFVSKQTLDSLRLQIGDVLMNEGGDYDKLGRGTVWRGEIQDCIHQNHVFRVRPAQNHLKSYYLSYYAESFRGKKFFIQCSKQSTNLASINSTQLNSFPILKPSISEQALIEDKIQAINSFIKSMEINEDKLQKQKSGLMQDLLTGKVEVSVFEDKEVYA